MKRLNLIIGIALLCVCLYPNPVQADPNVYPFVSAGALSDAVGHFEFAMWAGGEIPAVSKDSYAAVLRTGYFYGKQEKDWQAISGWLLTRKEFGLSKYVAVYGAMGYGIIQNIQDGEDQTRSALKSEFGTHLYGKFGLAVGFDYYPNENRDYQHIYFGLHFLPDLK